MSNLSSILTFLLNAGIIVPEETLLNRRHTIIAAGGLLVPLISWGQPMRLHIVAPSTTAVSLEDFDRAALGAKLGTQFGPETAILVNNSDRTIAAATFIWTAPNPLKPERPHKYVLHTDIFQAPGMNPIMVAHSRTVVGPGVLVSESGKGYQGGSVGAAQQPGQFSTWGDVTVTIDAVMFSDGEVVGPDTRHLLEETQAQQTARSMLKGKVSSAGGTRQTLQGMLASSQFTPTNAQDVRVANALRDLTQQALMLVPEPGQGPRLPQGKRMATVEMWLNSLPQIPNPFKKGQQQ